MGKKKLTAVASAWDCRLQYFLSGLTLLHSERPKLYTILAFLSYTILASLSAIGLKKIRQQKEPFVRKKAVA